MRAAFEATHQLLKRRVEALVALPLNEPDKSAQWQEISRIGEIC